MSAAKGELSINVPAKGIDWEVFRVGQLRITSNDENLVQMRLLLDDKDGHEIGFVTVLAKKEIVFGL